MKRIQSLDLARGFTVFFIAPIHAVLAFSKPSVYNTPFGQFLAFIAEGPGAQLLMVLMGISFVLSKHTDFVSVLKRSSLMLLSGYLLNFCKFVLPAILNLLPAGLYTELGVHRDCSGYLHLLLTGDILQFAAIALLFMYFISLLPHYPIWALLFAIVVCFGSPVLFDVHNKNVFVNYLLELLSGKAPRVYFPLMPWLMYPLIGLTIGYYLKKGKPLLFVYGMITGFVMMLVACASWMPYAKEFNISFYRTYPSGSFYHIGIVLVWLYLAHWIAANGYQHHPLLFKFFDFISRHITLIYFVQWIIICWSLPLIGFRTLDTISSIMVTTLFAAATILITGALLFFKKRSQ